jgi:hypothetical protein
MGEIKKHEPDLTFFVVKQTGMNIAMNVMSQMGTDSDRPDRP